MTSKYAVLGRDRRPPAAAPLALRTPRKLTMLIPCTRSQPENLLVGSDGEIKIADFGVSHFFEQEDKTDDATTEKEIEKVGQLTKTEGTYYFFAPEMCTKGPFNAYACDVWALGICVWAMVFGTLPFKGGNPVELFDLIQTQGARHILFCNPARLNNSQPRASRTASRLLTHLPSPCRDSVSLADVA